MDTENVLEEIDEQIAKHTNRLNNLAAERDLALKELKNVQAQIDKIAGKLAAYTVIRKMVIEGRLTDRTQ